MPFTRTVRLALVGSAAGAALVLADAALAGPEVSPTTLQVGRTETLTFIVPDERDDSTIAFVQVVLPPSIRRESGDPTWNGSGAGAVIVELRVTPREAGDFAIAVEQAYSDGEDISWGGGESSDTPAPVVHVAAAGAANRDRLVSDRLVIVLLAAAIVVAAFALRRRRGHD